MALIEGGSSGKNNLTKIVKKKNIAKKVIIGSATVAIGAAAFLFHKYNSVTKNFIGEFSRKPAKYVEKELVTETLGDEIYKFVNGQPPNLYRNVVEYKNGTDSIRAIYKIGERTIEDSLFIYDIPDEIQVIKQNGTKITYSKKGILTKREQTFKINEIKIDLYSDLEKCKFIHYSKQARNIRMDIKKELKSEENATNRMNDINKLHQNLNQIKDGFRFQKLGTSPIYNSNKIRIYMTNNNYRKNTSNSRKVA